MLEACGMSYIEKSKDKLTSLNWVVCAEGVLHKTRNLDTILSTCGDQFDTASLNS